MPKVVIMHKVEDMERWPSWAQWLGDWGPDFLWARFSLKASHGYPPDTPGNEGFSPRPTPKLVATYKIPHHGKLIHSLKHRRMPHICKLNATHTRLRAQLLKRRFQQQIRIRATCEQHRTFNRIPVWRKINIHNRRSAKRIANTRIVTEHPFAVIRRFQQRQCQRAPLIITQWPERAHRAHRFNRCINIRKRR